MASEFCSKCGTPRAGAFRYCRSCGFDFDGTTATQPAVRPPAIPEPQVRSGSRSEKILVALVLLAIIGVAFVLLNGSRAPGPGVDSANIPPAGTVWFGSSFDPKTFAISDRLTTVTANQGFSFVAHLSRTIDASELAIRTSWNGQLVASVAVSAKGSGDAWGFSPGPLFAAGEWKYDLTDIGGNVLATGTITATP